MHGHAKQAIWFAAACGLWACSGDDREPTPVEPAEQHVVAAPEAPAAEAQAAEAPAQDAVKAVAPAAAPPAEDDAEWEKVRLEDEAPLCVFAGHEERAKAPFVKDVHKQTLRADSKVVFGAFSRGCQNKACDTGPSLQCWVDNEEPNTLVVHSRLWFKHKRGTVCTKDCSPVTAGCETAVLKAGKYRVKYGARTFSLRVPSVMRAPCFEMK